MKRFEVQLIIRIMSSSDSENQDAWSGSTSLGLNHSNMTHSSFFSDKCKFCFFFFFILLIPFFFPSLSRGLVALKSLELYHFWSNASFYQICTVTSFLLKHKCTGTLSSVPMVYRLAQRTLNPLDGVRLSVGSIFFLYTSGNSHIE